MSQNTAIATSLQKISTYCLDAIFPKRCLGCKTFDTWLCKKCHTRFGLVVEQKCPLCTIVITPDGKVCLKCRAKKDVFIDSVFTASYQDALLKKVIHAYKYRFIKDLASPLALLLAQSLQNSHLPAPDVIIPVPLHKRRLRWRGFNQSQLLALELDLQISLELGVLKRTKYTTAQVKVKSRSRRLNNLQKAFTVQDSNRIRGKHILLIDDITTTATTFNECAKALKKAGATKVTGLALARE